MKYIAIIGYGVVGGGITAVIEANKEKIKSVVGDEVEVKYILDLRDFPDSPYANRVVHDIAPIIEDKTVELVCETMGGSHPAYEFSVKCMEAGKSVVTSNKEVVANFGDKLLACAKANGVSYLFEASVGGGIPVIRSINTAMSQDNITKIRGIVNGTTNYILTKMKNEGRDFADVLAEAQELGYAERDPSADIDAIDAKRKIIILTALATGVLLDDADVYAGTLRTVTQEDISAAQKLDSELKLLACANVKGDSIEAFACPMIVPHANPISHISDVYNGISLTSDVTGDIMYYGRGAGRLPTAGAVVADVCAVLSGAAKYEYIPTFEKVGDTTKKAKSFDEIEFTYYIRANCTKVALCDKLEAVCDSVKIISENAGVTEAVAGKMTAKTLASIMPDAVAIRILD